MKYRMFALGALITIAGCSQTLNLFSRPQEPSTRPYVVEVVRFSSGTDGVTIEGELTMPTGPGPHRAVVLISGSGPQDRNEAVAGHKPFLVLSDHLTRNGIAVLRYDERGVGKSTGNFANATGMDFAKDAAAAFRWLQSRPEIDAQRIGYLGHSEGGYIAPLAARTTNPSFMTFLASPAEPLLPNVIFAQKRDMELPKTASSEMIVAARLEVLEYTDILRASNSVNDARTRLREYLKVRGATEAEIHTTLQNAVSPWWLFYANYDPAPALRNFGGPVLALFGGTDRQVNARDQVPAMKRLLRNPNSKIVVFPGHNHLFQRSSTGAVHDYVNIVTTIEPEVLNKISTWIKGVAQ